MKEDIQVHRNEAVGLHEVRATFLVPLSKTFHVHGKIWKIKVCGKKNIATEQFFLKKNSLTETSVSGKLLQTPGSLELKTYWIAIDCTN